MYNRRQQPIDDYDLIQQLSRRLQQMDPSFDRFVMDHVDGDPAAIARASGQTVAYAVDAVYRQMIETMTTERYLLCSNVPADCY